MSELNKKYLDLVGLKKYDALIKALIASGDQKLADDIAALEAKIGEIDVEGSVAQIVAEINEKIANLEAKVSANEQNIVTVSNRVTAVEETIKELGKINGGESLGDIVNEVKANTAAIATLNGDGVGSVTKIAADAVAAVVAGAESDFDTLKEVADWIASDKEGSAALQTTVSEHTESISTINGELDALEAKVDEDIANLTTHMSEAAIALSEVDSRLDALEAFEETHDSIKIADIEGLFTTIEE